MNESGKTKKYILCALFIAFSAICAQLVIPIQPVPITMGTLAILMAGAMLGPKYGFLAILGYVLLGAVGAPVFSLGRSGVAMLSGPSGGFMLSWPFVALTVGFFVERFGKSYMGIIASMLLGNVVCYTFGITWFMFLTGTGLIPALTACMLPFIPGDTVKMLVGAFLAKRCKNYV